VRYSVVRLERAGDRGSCTKLEGKKRCDLISLEQGIAYDIE
jgi:hypothetical protein